MVGPKQKKVFIGFGLVLIAATLFGRLVFQTRQQERAAAAQQAELEQAGKAWSNLWMCALGGPTPDAEIPARARRIALAKRPPESWPAPCSAHARELFEHVTDASHPALRAALRDRFSCTTACVVSDPGRQMLNLAPLGADLPALPPKVPAPAMAAPPALTKTTLHVLAPADAEVVRRDVEAGRLELKSPSQGRFACALSVDDKRAQCTKLDPKVPPGASLVADSDRLLLVDGKDTFAPDGQTVKTHVGRVQGTSLFLQAKRKGERRWELAAIAGGKPNRLARIELPAAVRPWLTKHHVAWIDADGQLQHRALTPEGDLLGKQSAAGRLDKDLRFPPRRCATEAGHALVFGLPPAVAMSWADHEVTAPIAFAPSRAQPASAPSAAPAKAQPSAQPPAQASATEAAKDFGMAGLLESTKVDDAPWGSTAPTDASPLYAKQGGMKSRAARAHRARRRAHRGRVAVGCSARAASVFWRQPRVGRTELHRISCTRGGTCEETVETLANVDPQSWWWVGPVGEQVVTLWRGKDGLLRLRHGAFDELAQAKDVILLDSESFGGPKTLGVEVFPAGRAVAFWFRSQTGTHAVVIDEAGQVTSLGPP